MKKILVINALGGAQEWVRKSGAVLLDEISGMAAVEIIETDRIKAAQCTGCFLCWIKTPGECVMNDDAREIVKSIINSDALLLLTGVTFGGYSSAAKRLLDRILPLSHPGFEKVKGETHHRMRYDRFPDLLAAGFSEDNNEDETGLFHLIVQRNALNMRNRRCFSEVLYMDDGEPEIRRAAARLISGEIQADISAEIKKMTAPAEEAPVLSERKRALLISSSPKGKVSLSFRVVEYMAEQLNRHGIETEIEMLRASTGDDELQRAAERSLSGYDIVFTAFPLYVDALPGITTDLLERIHAAAAADKESSVKNRVFACFVNSGFPESRQNLTAVNICRNFALRSGFIWGGGLPFGSGEAVDKAGPLGDRKRGGPPAGNLLRALDLTAESLAKGGGVTPEAFKIIQRPPVPLLPFALWRIIFYHAGNSFWVKRAAAYGLKREDLDLKRYTQS